MHKEKISILFSYSGSMIRLFLCSKPRQSTYSTILALYYFYICNAYLGYEFNVQYLIICSNYFIAICIVLKYVMDDFYAFSVHMLLCVHTSTLQSNTYIQVDLISPFHIYSYLVHSLAVDSKLHVLCISYVHFYNIIYQYWLSIYLHTTAKSNQILICSRIRSHISNVDRYLPNIVQQSPLD